MRLFSRIIIFDIFIFSIVIRRMITYCACILFGISLFHNSSLAEKECWKFIYIIIPSDTHSLVEDYAIDNITFDLVDDMNAGKAVAWPILKNDKLYIAAGCDYMKTFIEELPAKYIVKETEMKVYKERYLEAIR